MGMNINSDLLEGFFISQKQVIIINELTATQKKIVLTQVFLFSQQFSDFKYHKSNFIKVKNLPMIWKKLRPLPDTEGNRTDAKEF